jgi:protein subunit release factor B
MQPRTPIVTVTKKDLIRQTFRSGGKGGQNQNKVESGVRLIHEPSGARAEGREYRDQPKNERAAFERLVATKEFQQWLKIETARRLGNKVPETPEQIKDRVNRTLDADFATGQVVVEEYEVVK